MELQRDAVEKADYYATMVAHLIRHPAMQSSVKPFLTIRSMQNVNHVQPAIRSYQQLLVDQFTESLGWIILDNGVPSPRMPRSHPIVIYV